MLVAKRARCREGKLPARARGVTRIDALVCAAHVCCVGARGVFHPRLRNIGSPPVRRRVREWCVACVCDADTGMNFVRFV